MIQKERESEQQLQTKGLSHFISLDERGERKELKIFY